MTPIRSFTPCEGCIHGTICRKSDGFSTLISNVHSSLQTAYNCDIDSYLETNGVDISITCKDYMPKSQVIIR